MFRWVAFCALVAAAHAALTPLILVPGLTGSQIQAKLAKGMNFCSTQTDWYTLWVNEADLIPGVTLSCWVANAQLVFNNATGFMGNVPGVSTRIPYWGTTTNVEYLDNVAFNYFGTFVKSFVAQGYVRNVTIRAAPYDWRYMPDNPAWVFPFQQLVEDTYAMNGNAKVAILAHSMGNVHMHYFFSQMTQAWKDQYVLTWVSVAPALGGAPEITQLFVHGDNEGIPIINPIQVRPAQQSMEGNFMLLPNIDIYPDPILMTPTKNYSAPDMLDLLSNTLGLPYAEAVYKRSFGMMSNVWDHPGVNVYCMYGRNHSTEMSYTYAADGSFDSSPTSITYSDGDGTMPYIALHACTAYNNSNTYSFALKEFVGQSHTGILTDSDFINAVFQAINN